MALASLQTGHWARIVPSVPLWRLHAQWPNTLDGPEYPQNAVLDEVYRRLDRNSISATEWRKILASSEFAAAADFVEVGSEQIRPVRRFERFNWHLGADLTLVLRETTTEQAVVLPPGWPIAGVDVGARDGSQLEIWRTVRREALADSQPFYLSAGASVQDPRVPSRFRGDLLIAEFACVNAGPHKLDDED